MNIESRENNKFNRWMNQMEVTELLEKPWFKVQPEEIPRTLEYPDDFPIYKFLEETVLTFPDNVATIF